MLFLVLFIDLLLMPSAVIPNLLDWTIPARARYQEYSSQYSCVQGDGVGAGMCRVLQGVN